MDIIGIGEEDPALSNDGREAEEKGVEAKGEELGPQRTTLAGATFGDDDSRENARGTAEVKLGRGSIHGEDPGPESLEIGTNHLEKGSAVNLV